MKSFKTWKYEGKIKEKINHIKLAEAIKLDVYSCQIAHGHC